MVKDTVPKFKNKIEKAFPIFRYHDRWKQAQSLFEQDVTLKIDYDYIVADKGYRISTAVDEPVGDGKFEMIPDVAWISDECKEAVADIKAICDEHGAKLVLLGVPNVFTWSPDRYNAVAYLAMDLEIPYYELNFMRDEVPIDWTTDAYDGGEHLNYWGAQKVTAYLGEYLDSLGIFEDKRADKQYAAWNEAQKKFFDEIKK